MQEWLRKNSGAGRLAHSPASFLLGPREGTFLRLSCPLRLAAPAKTTRGYRIVRDNALERDAPAPCRVEPLCALYSYHVSAPFSAASVDGEQLDSEDECRLGWDPWRAPTLAVCDGRDP